MNKKELTAVDELYQYAEINGWNINKLIGWSEASDFAEHYHEIKSKEELQSAYLKIAENQTELSEAEARIKELEEERNTLVRAAREVDESLNTYVQDGYIMEGTKAHKMIKEAIRNVKP